MWPPLLQGQSSLSSSQPSLQLVPGLGRGRVKTRITTLRPAPQLFILVGKDVPFLSHASLGFCSLPWKVPLELAPSLPSSGIC